jgi:serine/threonine-protein kinase
VNLRVGQVLVDTYRIERLIAEGGMGSVYEASHVRVPKRFAVKFLKLQLAGNAEALQRFRREAELIATFDHPNIVQLVDYNVDESGIPYIVMEYLAGAPLSDRLARGKFGVQQTVKVVGAVASALSSAHARDVIHRDLKPENIILVRDLVKVVDFGVAKLRGGHDLTNANTILGTVCYMAPEQLTGGKIDPRVDQYALAVIVYEMLTGKQLVQGENLPAQAMEILHGPVPSLSDVPPAFNSALTRALQKDPTARFPTIMEFFEALELAANSTMEHSAPDAPVDQEIGPEISDELPPLAAEPTEVTSLPPLSPEPTMRTPLPGPLPLPGIATAPGATANGRRASSPGTRAPGAGTPNGQRITDPSMNAVLPPLVSSGERITDPGMKVAPPSGDGDQPRVTAPSLAAVPMPPDWTSVQALPTTPGRRPRWTWLAVGAAAGVGVASLVWIIATVIR